MSGKHTKHIRGRSKEGRRPCGSCIRKPCCRCVVERPRSVSDTDTAPASRLGIGREGSASHFTRPHNSDDIFFSSCFSCRTDTPPFAIVFVDVLPPWAPFCSRAVPKPGMIDTPPIWNFERIGRKNKMAARILERITIVASTVSQRLGLYNRWLSDDSRSGRLKDGSLSTKESPGTLSMAGSCTSIIFVVVKDGDDGVQKLVTERAVLLLYPGDLFVAPLRLLTAVFRASSASSVLGVPPHIFVELSSHILPRVRSLVFYFYFMLRDSF